MLELLIGISVIGLLLFLNLRATDVGSGESILAMGWPLTYQTAIVLYGTESVAAETAQPPIVPMQMSDDPSVLQVLEMSWPNLAINFCVATLFALAVILSTRGFFTFIRTWTQGD